MEVYTDAEISALHQFRSRVRDALPDDFNRRDENLVRWLRARDLDLDKAEDLLRKSMKWRFENKIDSILEPGLDPKMFEQFPFFYDGRDKEGRVVITVEMGKWDIRSSVEKDGPEKYILYTRQILELVTKRVREVCEEHIKKNNQPRTVRYSLVCDYEGFSIRQLANMKAVNAILQVVATYESSYPETLETAYIINAPAVFSMLFNLMKPLMTARTLNKIKIFNSDENKWRPEVLKAINASEIRPKFGGTKKSC